MKYSPWFTNTPLDEKTIMKHYRKLIMEDIWDKVDTQIIEQLNDLIFTNIYTQLNK